MTSFSSSRKRKILPKAQDETKSPKRFKKQAHYSSGSSSESGEEGQLDLAKTRGATARGVLQANHATKKGKGQSLLASDDGNSDASKDLDHADEFSDLGEEDSEDASSGNSGSGSDGAEVEDSRKRAKRHDPSAFASSIKAILSSKLSTSKRVDPVLSRSTDALEATNSVSESKLDARARRKLKEEKRLASEKGRVRDVLLGRVEDGTGSSKLPPNETAELSKISKMESSAGEIALLEKRYRKTAQRGVVKLFNAVRASQVKGEEEARKSRVGGAVTAQKREQRVSEMGRKAFLDLIGAGGVEAR